MKVIHRDVLVAILSAFGMLRSASAGDWVELVRIKPEPPAILKVGEYVEVTVRYHLESRERAWIKTCPFMGGYGVSADNFIPKGDPPEVAKGEGEVTRVFTVAMLCGMNQIMLWMYDDKAGLAESWLTTDVVWEDPKYGHITPNPAFSGVDIVYVNRNLPGWAKLYEYFVTNGVRNVSWIEHPARRMELTIGPGIGVEAMQGTLAACLRYGSIDQIMTDPGPKRWNSNIYVGGLDVADCPPVPRERLTALLKPGLTAEEFHAVAGEWMKRHMLAEEKKTKERALQQARESRAMDAIMPDFLEEGDGLLTGIPTNGLIAYYPLEKDARDRCGLSENMLLENTEFAKGALHLNGVYALSGGYSATARIPMLNYEQFTVSLNFRPMDLDARHETIVIGGGLGSWWWEMMRADQGADLQLTFNFNEYVHVFKHTPIPAREWSSMVCAFDLARRKAVVYFNGTQLPLVELPKDFSLRVIGSREHMSGKQITFTNLTSIRNFHGQISNLVVYDRALSGQELDMLHTAMRNALPHDSDE